MAGPVVGLDFSRADDRISKESDSLVADDARPLPGQSSAVPARFDTR
jgi:hypothetical protein